MEWQAKALTKLFEFVPALLIVLGVIIALLGILQGVGYENRQLPNVGLAAQLELAILGSLLIGAGIWLYTRHGTAPVVPKDVKALGVRILYPQEGMRIGAVVNVQGTFEKLPPPGYELRSLRLYPKVNGFLPHGRVSVDDDKKTWEIIGFEVGGGPNDDRGIEVCIAGPDGQTLLNSWTEAHEVHKVAMYQLLALGKDVKWLDPMTSRTRDLLKCARVKVIRS